MKWAWLVVVGCGPVPTVVVAPGPTPQHELVVRADGLLAARCVSGDDAVAAEGVDVVTVRGLRADTTYPCEVRTTQGDVTVEATTHPLPAALAAYTIDVGGSAPSEQAQYILTNLVRITGFGTAADQYAVVLDPEGAIRWSVALPESDEAIALDPFGPDEVLLGGGLFVSTPAQRRSASGEVVAELEDVGVSHEVLAWGDGVVVVRQQLIGFRIEHYGWDGALTWAVTDQDDPRFPSAYVNSVEMVGEPPFGVLIASVVEAGRVLVIDPQAATLLYDLGPGAEIDVSGGAAFDWVHDVGVVSCDSHPLCLLYYDNGTDRGWSRAVMLGVDAEAGSAELLRTFQEDGWYEPHLGSVQALDGGDWLIGRGHSEVHAPDSLDTSIVRVRPDGSVPWRLDVGPSEAAIYRARSFDPCGFVPSERWCGPK